MNDIEKGIATKLVELAIDAGYTVSVMDEEDSVLRRSRFIPGIIDALGASGLNNLIIRDPGQGGKRIGSVLLIWGNDKEVISDHSDNAIINALVARALMEQEAA